MKKGLLLLFSFHLIFLHSFSQSTEVDSLEIQLKTLKQDTNRVQVLGQLVSKVRKYDIDKALIYAEEGFALAEELEVEQAQCQFYLEFIIMHLNLGKTDRAMELALEGIDFCGSVDSKGKQATAYFLASNLQLTMGNVDQSLEYASQSIKASEEADYTYGKILGFKAMGDIEETRGNLTDALKHYEAGMKIASEHNITSQEMVLSNNLGIMYDDMGWYDKALEYYLSAAGIAKENNEMIGLISFLANVADIYSTQNETQKALDISLEALGYAQTANAKKQLPALYAQIGTFNGKLGNKEEALKYQLLSKDISEEIGDQRSLSFAYDNLAKIAEENRDFQQAEMYYMECLSIREKMNFKGGLARIHNSLGNFYANRKQYQKALTHFDNGKRISEEMNYVEQMNRNYRDLAQCYASLGQFEQAFQYQGLHLSLKDTLWNTDRNKQIVRMETQFETKQKEAAIIQLEEEARLSVEARAKDRQIKYLLIAGAALLAALVFLFFNRSRILRSKNQKIEETSSQLASSLQEKETLLKEIHHRVKNNLQIISSLLNLQTRQVTDDKTLATIREGQSRVQAMSLIHQKLYQSERLSKVDIENYLDELTDNLSRMFEDEGKNIEVQVHAPGIEFDIDTAIPLGLIVNELVSNAYKYAFDGQAQGNIKIAIKSLDQLEYELKVEDNGHGLPLGFEPGKSKSLGLRLVNILSEQLRGSVEASSTDGALFTIRFKDVRAFQAAA
jgi:two-component sensor histidine kinase